MDERVRVGVGVMVFKDGKILLHVRKGSHGDGEWSFPGGHLEYRESLADCVRRECMEEAGIRVKNIRFSYVVNDFQRYAPKHYLHVGFLADWYDGEPKVMEPDKADNWGWYAWDSLPEPLFEFARLSIDAYKYRRLYYSAIP
jgi:8-oxo-dGTP diphosphatase